MHKILLIILFSVGLFCTQLRAQFVNFSFQAGRAYFWTWISGTSTLGSTGTYGTLGTPSTSNNPAARGYACGAYDSSGNFWVMGGDTLYKAPYLLNDLWRYNSTTNEWTWMSGSSTRSIGNAGAVYGTKGVPSASNSPGARAEASCAVDSAGNFWLFGGFLSTTTNSNELWKFNPVTREWTWVSGSSTANDAGSYGTQGVAAASNLPPARERAAAFLGPNNTIWIFGGYDDSVSGRRNDLWKYDIATGMWTWVSGQNTIGGAGTFGTRGVPSTSNIPSARRMFQSSVDVDSSGNFWIFGGDTGSSNYLNDIWKYNPTTNEWTWVAGSNTGNQTAVYGGKMVTHANNHPDARILGAMWVSITGDIMVFGGWNGSESNDLWVYSVANDNWTWVAGANTGGASDTFGTINVTGAGNGPGGRDGQVRFKDSNGNIYMFGGVNSTNRPNNTSAGPSRNDLWKVKKY